MAEMNSFPNGVASGDTTQDSTILWTRSTVLGDVTFEYSTDLDFNNIEGTVTSTVTDEDIPVKVEVTGLTSGTEYYYRVTDAEGNTATGNLKTAREIGIQSGLTFGVSGDWSGVAYPFPAISNAPEQKLDFFVEHGDTVYADAATEAVLNPDGTRKPRAETLEEYRAKQAEVYGERFGENTWDDLRASTSVLATIDDHEVINDFAGGADVTEDPLERFSDEPGTLQNDSILYENGLQAFQEYNPLRDEFYVDTGEDPRTDGERQLYRYNTYGSDAGVFILDARSFRDAALEQPEPENPESVEEFLTASLTEDRTLLGKPQLEDLKQDLLAAEESGLTWKFVMAPEPVQNFGPEIFPADRVEGYAKERTEILSFIEENNIDNVVFVAADIHGTMVNNLTYQEEPGGEQIATSAFEVTTGGVGHPFVFGDLVTFLGSEEEIATYEALPVASDSDSEVNDKDDFLKQFINEDLANYGYDPVGLDDNLASAEGLIDAELLQGDYVAAHTFGWTQFDIDPETQQLKVTTYGVERYSEEELQANPEDILSRTPEIVSQFIVNPQPNFLENNGDTNQSAQMRGLNGYAVDPFFTIGEQLGDYAPPGIPDGLGAFALDDDTIRLLSNHELRAEAGYTYTLANGTQLTGARVSFFDINKETLAVEDAGLAYDTIINRAGEVVDEATDLEFEGINRLCSAQYIAAHQFGEGRGLEDAMFFTGEETFGGTEFVIDPATNTMYAVPWMGRAAWESVTELDTGTTERVALLVGDDREAAPLLMYVGEKDTSEGADFVARNGLSNGKLYVWKPDGDVADSPEDEDSAPDPTGFNGTGSSLGGTWVELDYYRSDLAGKTLDGETLVDTNGERGIQDEIGYDDRGFATQALQDQLFIDAGGFQFSRPEDLATNPDDGTEAVLASTGRSGRFPEDSWGTTLKIDTDFDDLGNPITAQIDILYDGDDAGAGQFESPDFGLRSPDNLEWADDGQIYLQEDRSFSEFGLTSGEEASIWRLDPDSGVLTRVAQMDRSAVPEGQTDPEPEDIGNWESSGVIDVSSLFGEAPGTKFIFDVQAHSLEDGVIASEGLVQGGQIAFLIREEVEEEPTFELDFGTLGEDVIEVSGSERLIFGGADNDFIDAIASEGNNRIYAGSGDDTLILGTGDRLVGAAGDDIFYATTGGENTITGGEGADQFWIAVAEILESTNIITDFTSGEDVIGIAGLGIGFDDLSLTQDGDNTFIAANGSELAILLDVDSTSLSSDNFAFV